MTRDLCDDHFADIFTPLFESVVGSMVSGSIFQDYIE